MLKQLLTQSSTVLSNSINKLYQIDPTITKYEIKFPNSIAKEIADVKEIIELIIKSIDEQIEIPQEKQNLFTSILILLGENNQNKPQFKIKNEVEVLSLLNTHFHSQLIEYLSGHFIEFLKRSNFHNISEEIMKEVIDFYFDTKKINENESAFDEEKKIFELMKEKQEDYLIIIYFLLNINLDEYDEDMTEYVCNNISDEIIIKEFTKIIFFIRKNLSKLINGNNLILVKEKLI